MLRSLLLAAAFVAGAATVPGFAPYAAFALPLFTLAALFWLWLEATPGRALFLGWMFGLGLFLAGASWIYVSLNTFGAMPLPLAALATLLFCAFLALFPALAGWCAARWRKGAGTTLLLLCPAAWTLTEWTRDWIFTGFPWLALGYSQVPLSPLAGYAPLLGVFGVSLLLAVCSGLLVLSCIKPRTTRVAAGIGLAVVLGAGFALRAIEWTEPTRTSATVSLLQGNVAQDMKWREDKLAATLKGTSSFAEEFPERGPRDRHGRSLRDLDLTGRMFKYPCSYLIYSASYQTLPKEAKDYLEARLWEVLIGSDRSHDFAHLSAADRRAIGEILIDTLPNHPESWRAESLPEPGTF